MCTQVDHIGTTGVPRKRHTFVLNPIVGTYAVGDMLSSALVVLSCAALSKGGAFKVVQVSAYEKSPAGTQVKADLRVHFFRESYTPAAQNAPFKSLPAASYTSYLGSIGIASSDYVELGDGAGTDPDYAKATVIPATPEIWRSDDTNNVAYANVEIVSASTFGASEITIIIETELS